MPRKNHVRNRAIRLVGSLLVLLCVNTARARGDEVRTFSVSIDGKPAGTHVIALTVAADGIETITTAADVKLRMGGLSFTYELHSIESWKNGVLTSIESRSNVAGTKKSFKGISGEGGLSVTVNKQTHKLGWDAISASGGRLPTWDRVRDVVFIDLEDGSSVPVRVEPLGACRVMVNGQPVEALRFRLTGKDVHTEWWFDRQGRAIRQELKWDGHKVVIELIGAVR